MYNDYDSRREGEIIKHQMSKALWLPFVIPEQVEVYHESQGGQVETDSSEQARIEELSCS
jgi:hypothetical protein